MNIRKKKVPARIKHVSRSVSMEKVLWDKVDKKAVPNGGRSKYIAKILEEYAV